MWLLDKMLRRLLKKGELIVVDHDGKEYVYGKPEPGWAPLRIRSFDVAIFGELGPHLVGQSAKRSTGSSASA